MRYKEILHNNESIWTSCFKMQGAISAADQRILYTLLYIVVHTRTVAPRFTGECYTQLGQTPEWVIH